MFAARKKRMTRGDLLVGAVILAAAIVLELLLFSKVSRAPTAQVVLDGEVVLSCRLDELKEPVRYEVNGTYPLTLELSAQGVQVLETSCPGEDCKHTGIISTANRQIVCLPNRLVVTLQDADFDYDAMTG